MGIISSTSNKKIKSCSICLEPISDKIINKACGHNNFCKECILKWIQKDKTCPICRTKLVKKNILSVPKKIYCLCSKIKKESIENISLKKNISREHILNPLMIR